ncbi:BnaC09g22010D [Brassica napus]|uniref:BnaC09g22010D protein n=1 Tax=Brassica napus TaxID=3708 RepID=A0A078H3B3_BRANA|nr:BnaC09g22010D [Brassica napus]
MSGSEEDDVLPRFFKVFLSQTASESMAIPMSFNENLEDPLPQTAKLQGIGSGVWTVSFKKIRDRAYFTSGWSKFAEDHEFKDGEFLTFVYDGSHTFEVSIFGRSGCKEIRAAVETVNLSDVDSDKKEEEEEDSSVVADTNKEEEEEGDDDDPSFDAGEDDEVSQSVDSDDIVSNAEVVEGFSNLEVESNPCFTSTLKSRIYELLIPANVVKEHKLKFCDRIKYIDGEGIMHGVKGKWTDDRIFFKGWDKICRRLKSMILSTGTVAQGFNAQNRVNRYEDELKRGSIYTLTNFFGSNNKRFKFHSYADFEANCDLRGDLHDVVGHLKLVDGQTLHQRLALCTNDGSTSRKIMVHLQLKDGPVVNVDLWDQAAENFRRKFDESVTTPTILMVTTVNPKRLGGKLCLSSMSSSRVFLDQEVDPTKELAVNPAFASSVNTVEVVNVETLTIREIADFIKRQPAKIAYFDCIATIDDVKLGTEWYYIACKVCQTKLTHGPTMLMCPKCCNENATALANFRVELSVYDNEEQCTFIILGDAGKELTGRKAT